MAYKIVLDAGHGGTDPGAIYKERKEKDDNLALTLAVGKILEDNGVDVVYTRTEDVYQTPFEKARIANQSGADYFISFQRNSSPEDNQYQGVEVLVYDKSGNIDKSEIEMFTESENDVPTLENLLKVFCKTQSTDEFISAVRKQLDGESANAKLTLDNGQVLRLGTSGGYTEVHTSR